MGDDRMRGLKDEADQTMELDTVNHDSRFDIIRRRWARTEVVRLRHIYSTVSCSGAMMERWIADYKRKCLSSWRMGQEEFDEYAVPLLRELTGVESDRLGPIVFRRLRPGGKKAVEVADFCAAVCMLGPYPLEERLFLAYKSFTSCQSSVALPLAKLGAFLVTLSKVLYLLASLLGSYDKLYGAARNDPDEVCHNLMDAMVAHGLTIGDVESSYKMMRRTFKGFRAEASRTVPADVATVTARSLKRAEDPELPEAVNWAEVGQSFDITVTVMEARGLQCPFSSDEAADPRVRAVVSLGRSAKGTVTRAYAGPEPAVQYGAMKDKRKKSIEWGDQPLAFRGMSPGDLVRVELMDSSRLEREVSLGWGYVSARDILLRDGVVDVWMALSCSGAGAEEGTARREANQSEPFAEGVAQIRVEIKMETDREEGMGPGLGKPAAAKRSGGVNERGFFDTLMATVHTYMGDAPPGDGADHSTATMQEKIRAVESLFPLIERALGQYSSFGDRRGMGFEETMWLIRNSPILLSYIDAIEDALGDLRPGVEARVALPGPDDAGELTQSEGESEPEELGQAEERTVSIGGSTLLSKADWSLDLLKLDRPFQVSYDNIVRMQEEDLMRQLHVEPELALDDDLSNVNAIDPAYSRADAEDIEPAGSDEQNFAYVLADLNSFISILHSWPDGSDLDQDSAEVRLVSVMGIDTDKYLVRIYLTRPGRGLLYDGANIIPSSGGEPVVLVTVAEHSTSRRLVGSGMAVLENEPGCYRTDVSIAGEVKGTVLLEIKMASADPTWSVTGLAPLADQMERFFQDVFGDADAQMSNNWLVRLSQGRRDQGAESYMVRAQIEDEEFVTTSAALRGGGRSVETPQSACIFKGLGRPSGIQLQMCKAGADDGAMVVVGSAEVPVEDWRDSARPRRQAVPVPWSEEPVVLELLPRAVDARARLEELARDLKLYLAGTVGRVDGQFVRNEFWEDTRLCIIKVVLTDEGGAAGMRITAAHEDSRLQREVNPSGVCLLNMPSTIARSHVINFAAHRPGEDAPAAKGRLIVSVPELRAEDVERTVEMDLEDGETIGVGVRLHYLNHDELSLKRSQLSGLAKNIGDRLNHLLESFDEAAVDGPLSASVFVPVGVASAPPLPAEHALRVLDAGHYSAGFVAGEDDGAPAELVNRGTAGPAHMPMAILQLYDCAAGRPESSVPVPLRPMHEHNNLERWVPLLSAEGEEIDRLLVRASQLADITKVSEFSSLSNRVDSAVVRKVATAEDGLATAEVSRKKIRSIGEALLLTGDQIPALIATMRTRCEGKRLLGPADAESVLPLLPGVYGTNVFLQAFIDAMQNPRPSYLKLEAATDGNEGTIPPVVATTALVTLAAEDGHARLHAALRAADSDDSGVFGTLGDVSELLAGIHFALSILDTIFRGYPHIGEKKTQDSIDARLLREMEALDLTVGDVRSSFALVNGVRRARPTPAGNVPSSLLTLARRSCRLNTDVMSLPNLYEIAVAPEALSNLGQFRRTECGRTVAYFKTRLGAKVIHSDFSSKSADPTWRKQVHQFCTDSLDIPVEVEVWYVDRFGRHQSAGYVRLPITVSGDESEDAGWHAVSPHGGEAPSGTDPRLYVRWTCRRVYSPDAFSRVLLSGADLEGELLGDDAGAEDAVVNWNSQRAQLYFEYMAAEAASSQIALPAGGEAPLDLLRSDQARRTISRFVARGLEAISEIHTQPPPTSDETVLVVRGLLPQDPFLPEVPVIRAFFESLAQNRDITAATLFKTAEESMMGRPAYAAVRDPALRRDLFNIHMSRLDQREAAENMRKQEEKAARLIQGEYGLYLGRRRDHERKSRSAVAIQSRFRTYRARVQTVEMLARVLTEELRHAVVTIQRHFRGHMTRRCVGLVVGIRHEAAAVIQAGYRAYARRQTSAMGRAATAIQSRVRAHLQRKKFGAEKARATRGATLMQALVRRRMAQRQFAEKKELFGNAATLIQSRFRSHQQRGRLDQMKTERGNEKATRIQCMVRGRRARSEYKMIQDKRHRSASVIQNAYRRRLARERLIRRTNRRHVSATKIQAVYRGRRVRRRHAENNDASRKIGGSWRRKKAREERRRMIGEMNRACTAIQTRWRGYQARMLRHHLEEIEAEYRYGAATMIQAMVRGRQGRERADNERQMRVIGGYMRVRVRSKMAGAMAAWMEVVGDAHDRRVVAALRLQAWYRGWRGRVMFINALHMAREEVEVKRFRLLAYPVTKSTRKCPACNWCLVWSAAGSARCQCCTAHSRGHAAAATCEKLYTGLLWQRGVFRLKKSQRMVMCEDLCCFYNITAVEAILKNAAAEAESMLHQCLEVLDSVGPGLESRAELKAWTHDNLAWMYFREGKKTLALDNAKKAFGIVTRNSGDRTNSVTAALHCAAIYSQLGRRTEALDLAKIAHELSLKLSEEAEHAYEVERIRREVSQGIQRRTRPDKSAAVAKKVAGIQVALSAHKLAVELVLLEMPGAIERAEEARGNIRRHMSRHTWVRVADKTAAAAEDPSRQALLAEMRDIWPMWIPQQLLQRGIINRPPSSMKPSAGPGDETGPAPRARPGSAASKRGAAASRPYDVPGLDLEIVSVDSKGSLGGQATAPHHNSTRSGLLDSPVVRTVLAIGNDVIGMEEKQQGAGGTWARKRTPRRTPRSDRSARSADLGPEIPAGPAPWRAEDDGSGGEAADAAEEEMERTDPAPAAAGGMARSRNVGRALHSGRSRPRSARRAKSSARKDFFCFTGGASSRTEEGPEAPITSRRGPQRAAAADLSLGSHIEITDLDDLPPASAGGQMGVPFISARGRGGGPVRKGRAPGANPGVIGDIIDGYRKELEAASRSTADPQKMSESVSVLEDITARLEELEYIRSQRARA